MVFRAQWVKTFYLGIISNLQRSCKFKNLEPYAPLLHPDSLVVLRVFALWSSLSVVSSDPVPSREGPASSPLHTWQARVSLLMFV